MSLARGGRRPALILTKGLGERWFYQIAKKRIFNRRRVPYRVYKRKRSLSHLLTEKQKKKKKRTGFHVLLNTKNTRSKETFPSRHPEKRKVPPDSLFFKGGQFKYAVWRRGRGLHPISFSSGNAGGRKVRIAQVHAQKRKVDPKAFEGAHR